MSVPVVFPGLLNDPLADFSGNAVSGPRKCWLDISEPVHLPYIGIRTADDNHSPTAFSRSRKSFDKLVNVLKGVVEMRRDSESITTRRGYDVSGFEVSVKGH